MQLYQLHIVEKLATRQSLGDQINNIVICRNLQHLDFSMLDYSFDKMHPHIDVLGSLMIRWVLRHVYCTLTITLTMITWPWSLSSLAKPSSHNASFTTSVRVIYSASVVDKETTLWSVSFQLISRCNTPKCPPWCYSQILFH